MLPCVVAFALALTPPPEAPEDPRAISEAARKPNIVVPTAVPEPTPASPTREPGTTAAPPVASPSASTPPASGPSATPASRATPDASVASASRCLAPRSPCRRATIPGIALTSLGTVALAGGIAMRLVPDYPDPDSAVHDRSLHPPGIVLVAVGATVLVTGVAAIVTGQVLHRRAPKAAAAIHPLPGGFAF